MLHIILPQTNLPCQVHVPPTLIPTHDADSEFADKHAAYYERFFKRNNNDIVRIVAHPNDDVPLQEYGDYSLDLGGVDHRRNTVEVKLAAYPWEKFYYEFADGYAEGSLKKTKADYLLYGWRNIGYVKFFFAPMKAVRIAYDVGIKMRTEDPVSVKEMFQLCYQSDAKRNGETKIKGAMLIATTVVEILCPPELLIFDSIYDRSLSDQQRSEAIEGVRAKLAVEHKQDKIAHLQLVLDHLAALQHRSQF